MLRSNQRLRKTFHAASLMVLAFGLVACDEDRASPDETYRAYHAKVVEGRSFEEDIAFHA